MRRFKAWKALKIIAMVALAITLFGYVVERLWNWLLPPIAGVHPITFVQAIGLLILSKILFGGIHRHGPGRHWKRGLEDRWAAMTPEERDRFRAGLHNKSFCKWSRSETPASEATAK
jgi:hypothetical protein